MHSASQHGLCLDSISMAHHCEQALRRYQGSTARSDPSGIWPMPAAGRRAAAGCPRFWAHFEISERAKPALRFQTCAGSPLLLDSLGLAPAGCSNSCKVHRNLQALLCQDKQASSPQSLASSPNKAASEEAASAEAGPSSIDFLEDVVEIPGLSG